MERDISRELDHTVRTYLREHVGQNSACVVAVSGGVDSMVLLDLVRRAAAVQQIRVTAAHVNHGLRKTADRDQALVTETCARWGVPLAVHRVDLCEIPVAERRGLEADARRLRYQALAAAARAAGAGAVLLAHHADDQLETLLWRIVRGTSASGLGGMRSITERDGIRWIRPLLRFEKADLKGHAERYGIPFVEDETNRDTSIVRNYLRIEVVPRLRALQPNVARTAGRLAELLQEEDAWLEGEAQRVVEACVRWEPDGGCTLDLRRLTSFPRPLQRRAIKIILYCLASIEWTSAHVERIAELASSDRPSAVVTLPSGWTAWRQYDELRIGRRNLPAVAWSPPSTCEWRLADGASLCWPVADDASGTEWRFTCTAWSRARGASYPLVDRVPTRFELVIPRLPSVIVRAPHPGDRVAPLGMRGTKKLQDVFVDAKVPRWDRCSWPVVCAGDDILWLPGLVRSRLHLIETAEADGWWVRAERVVDVPEGP